VETFTFTIVLPPAPGAPELFAALSGQMARYIGLRAEEAGQAGGVLNRLVAERLGVGGPVAVTFVRPHANAPVRVAIAGPALAGDRAAASAGGGVVLETDGRESTLTLSWAARNGG
jgi:hypothetical protein